MFGFVRSFVLVLCLVSLLATSATADSKVLHHAKNAVVDLAIDAADDGIDAQDVAKVAVHYVVDAASVPAAVSTASAMGVTASTGTAISSLSGAAAVSATSAAVGAPVSTALGAVGIAVAPAVVGGAIIVATGAVVAWGINTLFFSDD